MKLAVPRREFESRSADGLGFVDEPWPLTLAAVARPLLPAALMIAVFLLLRGHNAPGGGFVAGLIAGAALVMQQLANGLAWTSARCHLDTLRMIGAGLWLALGTGAAAFLFGRPFLTSASVHWSLPLFGELKISSTLAFDVGVLLVVTGTLLLILETLGRLGGTTGASADAAVDVPGDVLGDRLADRGATAAPLGRPAEAL